MHQVGRVRYIAQPYGEAKAFESLQCVMRLHNDQRDAQTGEQSPKPLHDI